MRALTVAALATLIGVACVFGTRALAEVPVPTPRPDCVTVEGAISVVDGGGGIPHVYFGKTAQDVIDRYNAEPPETDHAADGIIIAVFPAGAVVGFIDGVMVCRTGRVSLEFAAELLAVAGRGA